VIYNKKTGKILVDEEILQFAAFLEHEIETHKRAVERLLRLMEKGECPYGDETPEDEERCGNNCDNCIECLREFAYREEKK